MVGNDEDARLSTNQRQQATEGRPPLTLWLSSITVVAKLSYARATRGLPVRGYHACKVFISQSAAFFYFELVDKQKGRQLAVGSGNVTVGCGRLQ